MIAIHRGTNAALSQVCRRAAVNQLISRNDDLEAEKYGLIEENDALAAENAKLRLEVAEQAKQLSTMRCA
ncbi:hypothetical protein HZU72_17495 [Halomonas sp. QX-2]|uniref:Uncharacterized protein n=1 Tax=Vreelandella sedimenti TaxID=2729618 RepID=A0A7Z0NA13_9GAMM|nr:hypothetical protein [Halomonas sedimenti]NYT74208.1 hypothetical protein [Halomonas sedimenti]